jgi:uncharacterized membrane protein
VSNDHQATDAAAKHLDHAGPGPAAAMTRLLAALRRRFVAGLVVTVPLIATFLALRFLLRSLDGLLEPWVSALLGRHVPGLGALATLVVVMLVGLLATNVIGRRLVSWVERGIGQVPVVRGIYRASREIVATATLSKRQVFRDVVLIEYPRRGLWAYGFVTSYTSRAGAEQLANVFIPGPPVPTTGVLVAVPLDDLHFLDMSVEDALKLVLSGGLVAPAQLPEIARPLED